jgi:predicted HD superfamily hydrolase involved in NAD metabolism
VREIALALAERHGVDREKAWLAASIHDLARAMNGADLLVSARELGITVGPIEEVTPIFLHGPIASELSSRNGLNDPEVYDAVYWHSTARAGMTPLEKLVFIADKLDPQKAHRYPRLPEIRALAEESLDFALLAFLRTEIERLRHEGKQVHPGMLDARDELHLRPR